MGGIRQLAGQTLWYGLPTIASRFLGYIMNMALPFLVSMPGNTADLVQVYAIIPFLNVIFSYGLETAYFRFSQSEDKQKLYNTLSVSLIFSTFFFSAILWLFRDPLIRIADLQDNPSFISWMILILATDNLATIAFARLRQENRPKRYALARITGIIINLIFVFVFIGYIPHHLKAHSDSLFNLVYNPDIGLGYYLIGNFCGSFFTLLLLSGEFRQLKFDFDKQLWTRVLSYSYPLIIVGLGGMINDMLSRLIYRHVVDLPEQQADHELGIFANIFRIAVLITITIQAFRMAAEPFFFNKSMEENATKTYARVMKFFVIACCFMFLCIGLYLDVFRWIFTNLTDPAWAEGIDIVPLLALGNIFLGIYYNLSIWYKLTNRNLTGAMITLAGAAVTILLNIALIPIWHYYGAALATFCCYLFMMIISYRMGKKHYPIPYATKKLTAYVILSVLIYLLHKVLTAWISDSLLFSMVIATIFLSFFLWFVKKVETKELRKLGLLSSKEKSSS